MRNNDGNQVAPLTREHPRRRYTPVDYPGPAQNLTHTLHDSIRGAEHARARGSEDGLGVLTTCTRPG
jgi:hypothetical protein